MFQIGEDQPFPASIMPYDHFCYHFGPLGFTISDTYFRSNTALLGIRNCMKVVYKVLLFDKNYLIHLCQTDTLLSWCKKCDITLNAQKFGSILLQILFLGR